MKINDAEWRKKAARILRGLRNWEEKEFARRILQNMKSMIATRAGEEIDG